MEMKQVIQSKHIKITFISLFFKLIDIDQNNYFK